MVASPELFAGPGEQIENLEHPAFIARFERSGQADGICDRDTGSILGAHGAFPRKRYEDVLRKVFEADKEKPRRLISSRRFPSYRTVE